MVANMFFINFSTLDDCEIDDCMVDDDCITEESYTSGLYDSCFGELVNQLTALFTETKLRT